MRRVKYFKYSRFGPVTLYLGHIGSGTTLGSVIHLVRSGTLRTFSNIHLLYLPSEIFDLASVVEHSERYTGSTILLDDAEVLDSRVTSRSRSLGYLIRQSRKMGIKFILNSHSLQILDKELKDSITDIVKCQMPEKDTLLLQHLKRAYRTVWILSLETGKNERCIEWCWKLVGECLLKNVDKYYKYFNTLEVIGGLSDTHK